MENEKNLGENFKKIRTDMEQIYYDLSNWYEGCGLYNHVFVTYSELEKLLFNSEHEVEYIVTEDNLKRPDILLLLEWESINEVWDDNKQDYVKISLNWIKKNKPFDDVYDFSDDEITFNFKMYAMTGPDLEYVYECFEDNFFDFNRNNIQHITYFEVSETLNGDVCDSDTVHLSEYCGFYFIYHVFDDETIEILHYTDVKNKAAEIYNTVCERKCEEYIDGIENCGSDDDIDDLNVFEPFKF